MCTEHVKDPACGLDPCLGTCSKGALFHTKLIMCVFMLIQCEWSIPSNMFWSVLFVTISLEIWASAVIHSKNIQTWCIMPELNESMWIYLTLLDLQWEQNLGCVQLKITGCTHFEQQISPTWKVVLEIGICLWSGWDIDEVEWDLHVVRQRSGDSTRIRTYTSRIYI